MPYSGYRYNSARFWHPGAEFLVLNPVCCSVSCDSRRVSTGSRLGGLPSWAGQRLVHVLRSRRWPRSQRELNSRVASQDGKTARGNGSVIGDAKRLEALLENSCEAYLLIAADGKVQWLGHRILGYTPGELRG